jgi:hypothetical protein
MKTAGFLAIMLLSLPILTRAALVISISEPKITGQKAVIKLDMKNTFSQKLEGAKGTIFLMDAGGKVVGQASRWIIGGAKNRPPLGSEGNANYYFVVPAGKPFSKTRLMIDRIVLEGGKLANPLKDIVVKEANNK